MPSLLSQIGTKVKNHVSSQLDGLRPIEKTESEVFALTNSHLVRNSETNELLLSIGDGSTAEFFRLNAALEPVHKAQHGAYPNATKGARLSSAEGSALHLCGNRVFFINGLTNQRFQVGLTVVDTVEKFDLEGQIDGNNDLGLGADEYYSFRGHSDSRAADGFPICRDLQVLAAGPYAPQMVLASKGDNASANYFSRLPIRQREYLGSIADFMAFAEAGEQGQNNLAAASILDPAGNTLNSNLSQDEVFYCTRSANPILDGTSRHLTGVTSAANSSKIRFTVPGADLTQEITTADHLLIYGSDGENCNGKHQVTGVTFSSPDTLIDVNTDHATGDATVGTLRVLARLRKLTSIAV